MTNMWASMANDSNMSLTTHHVNNSKELKHLCLDVVLFSEVFHSGEHIMMFLVQCLKEWDITGKVSYVVEDNGRNIVSTANSSPSRNTMFG
jgi:hypothetical protein